MGVSLVHVQPDLLFWSDASDQDWGVNLLDCFVFWSLVSRRAGSVDQPQRAAGHSSGSAAFQSSPDGSDNRGIFRQYHLTGLHSKAGGHAVTCFEPGVSASATLGRVSGSPSFQFIMGSRNVVADSEPPRSVIGSEWTLVQEVVDELGKKWPATVDLFATSFNYRLPVYFSPLNGPIATGMDAFLQSWDGLQAYAFPPFALKRNVLNKLWSYRGMFLTLVAPQWPQKECYPELLKLSVEPPVTLPVCPDLLRQPHVHLFHQHLHVLHLHT